VIEFKDVTISYPSSKKNISLKKNVVINLSFELPKGSCGVLYGLSGSGKSTILRALVGAVPCVQGSITLGSYQVDKAKAKEVQSLRQSIGIVFPDAPLLTDRTIAENILLPLEIIGKLSKAKREERLQNVLDRFDLTHVAHLHPQQISVGEQQLALIARAVINEPLVLLVDEPTASLDEPTTEKVLSILQRENLRGMTLLIATHNEQVLYYFERAIPFHLVEGELAPLPVLETADL